MSFFQDFFKNNIFLAAATGWLVAQILKTFIHMFLSKEFVAERLVGSGGMPSSHSATVCSLATAACYEYGAGSFEFAISLIFAIVVMYDAMGVRRETGIQAKLLNDQKTEFNVIVGLCVGHDSLFTKYSDALVTTLVAKDRVLAHNPAGALYCADGPIRKRLYSEW